MGRSDVRARPPTLLLPLAMLACEAETAPPRDLGCERLTAGVYCYDALSIRCGEGEAVLRRETCAGGDRCYPGFGCGACEPGATDCGVDAETPRVCGTAHRWIDAPRCNAEQICERGRCVPGCDLDPESRETRGCDFWATQTINASLGRFFEGQRRDDFPFTVVASNPWRREVILSLDGGGARDTALRVAARGAATIETPWNAALVEGGSYAQRRSGIVRGGALHIRSSLRVTAYQFNPMKFIREPECEQGDACFSYSNDASMLFPTGALGRQYVVAALPTARELAPGRTAWTHAPGFIAVVGTAPSTRVTVYLRGDIEGSADGAIPPTRAGGRVEALLDPGDVLQLLGAHEGACADPVDDRRTGSTFCRPSATDDLTGSRVEATSPVAVFAGHDCAFAPFDRYACDHVEEQIPPIETLGMRYVVTRAAPVQTGRSPAYPDGEPTMVRVVAAYDDTEVRVLPDGVQATTRVSAGDAVTFLTTRNVEVSTSRPVLVASFLVGADYVPDPIPRPLSARGDPSMSIETPIAQWRAVHDLYVPFGFDPTWMDITGSSATRVLVDGNLVTVPSDTSLAGRSVWQVRLAPGQHRITGATERDAVGLRVYGYAPFATYMTRGGADLRELPAPQ